MQIAVAAMDERRVAPALGQARLLMVFQVEDEAVGSCEYRTLEGEGLSVEQGAIASWHSTGQGLVPLSASPEPANAAGTAVMVADSVTEELLQAVLDCQIVIAERIGPVEDLELRRLGILALPMTVPATPAEAVRMAVSGVPPAKGDRCGPCPHPSARAHERR